MLAAQRERLEEELETLEAEVKQLVSARTMLALEINVGNTHTGTQSNEIMIFV